MAAKPESKYIARVHRRLNASVYKQAMGLTATNGTLDYWYEGKTRDLWVEYKFIEDIPELINLCTRKTTPKLSKLQQLWMERANEHKTDTLVILGSNAYGIVLPYPYWKQTINELEFIAYSPKDIAAFIEKFVNENNPALEFKRGPGNSWETISPK